MVRVKCVQSGGHALGPRGAVAVRVVTPVRVKLTVAVFCRAEICAGPTNNQHLAWDLTHGMAKAKKLTICIQHPYPRHPLREQKNWLLTLTGLFRTVCIKHSDSSFSLKMAHKTHLFFNYFYTGCCCFHSHAYLLLTPPPPINLKELAPPPPPSPPPQQ